MTALDKIHNDYVDHKGQEKLRLQPELVTDLKFLIKNQKDLCQTINLGTNSYFFRLRVFLSNVLGALNPAFSSLHVDDDTSNSNQQTPWNDPSVSNSAKPLGGSIDGAAFIYTMNVFMQLAYIEKYTFDNLPNEIRIEYLVNLVDIKDLLQAFLKTIQEVLDTTTYDPSLTKFTTFNATLGLNKNKVDEPFDTPVSK